jgi:hypothetical protein
MSFPLVFWVWSMLKHTVCLCVWILGDGVKCKENKSGFSHSFASTESRLQILHLVLAYLGRIQPIRHHTGARAVLLLAL